MIPFFTKDRLNKFIKRDIEKSISLVISSNRFVQGPEVEKFEQRFTEYTRAKYCLAVSSGTAALEICARYIENKGGLNRTISIPAFSFVATYEPFENFYCQFYDNKKEFVESKFTQDVRIITHLYGEENKTVFNSNDPLYLIEDCAQAAGLFINGNHVGNQGLAGCFSFYPSKNLGTYGEGGAIITSDPDFYNWARYYRSHGGAMIEKNSGRNYRMAEIQAAILNINLNYLDMWNHRRKEIAIFYNSILSHKNRSFEVKYNEDSVYHLFTITCKDFQTRDKIISKLRSEKIGYGIHYNYSINKLQHVIDKHGYQSCPESEEFSRRTLSLPIFPELTDEEICEICKVILNE